MAFGGSSGYEVTVAFPEATNVVAGNRVMVNGFGVGAVKRLDVRDGRALVTIGVDRAHAPLHAGTKANVEFHSLLGERTVELVPAPASNPVIPNGGLLDGGSPRPELDQVLDALDAPTRQKLVGLVTQLNQLSGQNTAQLQATLQTAGPAVQALGEVLAAVGHDGPALHALVKQLGDLSGRLVAQQAKVRGTVDGLDRSMAAVAGEQEALQKAVAALPQTVTQANDTLAKVPGVVDAAVPLVQDLQGATRQLPAVAADLRPLAADLNPTVHDLAPMVDELQALLGETPGALQGLQALLPALNTAGQQLMPALRFLRPYTPELAGWATTWGGAAAGYDATGHWMRVYIAANTSSLARSPVTPSPFNRVRENRLPGQNVDQPWTDASGEGMH